MEIPMDKTVNIITVFVILAARMPLTGCEDDWAGDLPNV